MNNIILTQTPDAANLHIEPSQCHGVLGLLDAREVATPATPRRWSLLCGKVAKMRRSGGCAAAFLAIAMVFALPVGLNAEVGALDLSFSQNIIVATDASNRLDATSELWLVWDSVDRGSDLSSWPAANKVQYAGTVPSANSAYNFDRTCVPAGSVFRVIATSKARRLGEDGYVYAGANQYIDTGIKANAIYGLYIKFMYSANDYSQVGAANAYALLIADEGDRDFAIGRYAYKNKPDGYFYFKHRNTTGTPNGFIDISGTGLGQIHEIAVMKQEATLDDNVVVQDLEEGAVGKKNLRVWLNNGYKDKATSEEAQLSGKNCHARWYAVRFDDADGNAILNLVPAVYSGGGVLYDTVSGKCLVNANAETGDLTWGGSELGEVIDGTEATAAVSDAIANEMSVAVVSGGIDVTAPAGVLSSVSELWLVWDSEDRGGELEDWPEANRLRYLGSLSSTAATYRFQTGALSSKCVFRAIAKNPVRPLVEGGSVYVGKSQYINTGINANDIYGFSVKFLYSANDWNKTGAGTGVWASLIGDDPTYDFTIGRRASNGALDGQFYMRYRGVSVRSGDTQDLAFTLNDMTQPHVITVNNQTATLDGVPAVTSLEAGTIGKNALPVLIGCSWAENSTEPGTLSGRYCHAKWYAVRFDDAQGGVILNLIPAVLGDSEAVLYDTVSGKVLRNAGVGALSYDGTPGDGVGFVKSSSVPVLLSRKGLIIAFR